MDFKKMRRRQKSSHCKFVMAMNENGEARTPGFRVKKTDANKSLNQTNDKKVDKSRALLDMASIEDESFDNSIANQLKNLGQQEVKDTELRDQINFAIDTQVALLEKRVFRRVDKMQKIVEYTLE